MDMNEALRRAAGRLPAEPAQPAQPAQPAPDKLAIAQQYAEATGCTLTEALEKMGGIAPRIPNGAAGAGTLNPPSGKPTMNDILRLATGRG